LVSVFFEYVGTSPLFREISLSEITPEYTIRAEIVHGDLEVNVLEGTEWQQTIATSQTPG
jgi:hypothetical protein